MRSTQLRVGNGKVEAVLVAGGSGFKIYTAPAIEGWVISIKRRIIVVNEGSPEFKTVGRYVNLRFQPLPEQSAVKSEFDAFLRASGEPIPPTTQPPPDLQT
jgi:hypothetical protein